MLAVPPRSDCAAGRPDLPVRLRRHRQGTTPRSRGDKLIYAWRRTPGLMTDDQCLVSSGQKKASAECPEARRRTNPGGFVDNFLVRTYPPRSTPCLAPQCAPEFVDRGHRPRFEAFPGNRLAHTHTVQFGPPS